MFIASDSECLERDRVPFEHGPAQDGCQRGADQAQEDVAGGDGPDDEATEGERADELPAVLPLPAWRVRARLVRPGNAAVADDTAGTAPLGNHRVVAAAAGLLTGAAARGRPAVTARDGAALDHRGPHNSVELRNSAASRLPAVRRTCRDATGCSSHAATRRHCM